MKYNTNRNEMDSSFIIRLEIRCFVHLESFVHLNSYREICSVNQMHVDYCTIISVW